MAAIDPTLVARVPLLGSLLGLPLPDNELDPIVRSQVTQDVAGKPAGAVPAWDCGRRTHLLVLEECHWLDPLSHDLLDVMARAVADLPVLILLAYRPLRLARRQAQQTSALPDHSEIFLAELEPEAMVELAYERLAETTDNGDARSAVPDTLVRRLVQQAEGNPFFLEELIKYIHDRGIDFRDEYALTQLDVPSSLEGLVLSRLDQVTESRKIVLKVASVVGRAFEAAWLWGVYPDLGDPGECTKT